MTTTVHPGGGHADQHFSLTRFGQRPFARLQHLRPAMRVDRDATHLKWKIGASIHRFCPRSLPPPAAAIEPGLLTDAALTSTFPHMNDAEDPRPSEPLGQVLREDLDPLSVEELEARIAALHGEIARCEARKTAAVSHRSHADALFRK